MTNEDNRTSDLRDRILRSSYSREFKEHLLAILDGTQIAQLTSDTMAKRIFSPDLHRDRFDFILKRVMGDDSIAVDRSATNELPTESTSAKRTVSDLPAWLKDNRFANLEMQAVAQDYIFSRADIYSSRMLLFQYSVGFDQAKKDINYKNVPGVILVILMKDSPAPFKEFKSDKYIHRITEAVSDTGMRYPLLRQIAYVQLDKALELYLGKNYNEDDDIELLKLCAMIADINNEEIAMESVDDTFLSDIRQEAIRFSLDKEVQAMLISEEMEIWDQTVGKALERAAWEKKGIQEGRETAKAELIGLMSWLTQNGRSDEISKIISDNEYLEELMIEYQNSLNT